MKEPVPTNQVATILVVEDDLDLAEMLKTYFEVHGFQVLTAADGEDALATCRQNRPDLVLLDIRLPDIDGYEVARQLRSQGRTATLPIIFLTEKRARADRLQGLGLGAEDYISKPFDIQELRLRVRNALHRVVQPSLTNPVTNLPEGVLVEERLQECLQGGDWVLLRLSIVKMDRFKEEYGFVAADDAVRAIGLMIRNALREAGSATDFIGQLSSLDFLIVTTQKVVIPFCERLTGRFEQSVDFFYPVEARQEKEYSARRIELVIRKFSSQKEHFDNLAALKEALLRE